MDGRTSPSRRPKWHNSVLRAMPVFIVIGMFAGYAMAISCPVFYNHDQAFQAAAREQPRVVFSTYFYWYRSGASLTNNSHVVETWNPSRSSQLQFPYNWPGSRNVDTMLRNVSGVLYKDSLTYHPPAS